MYKKKISDEQFTLDCINKEFEIIGSPLHWDTFEDLCAWSKQPENKRWYVDNAFTSKEQYDQWKDYFMEHFYDWKPKYISKKRAYIEFSWFSLEYGFKYDFEDLPVGKYV